MIDAMGGVTSPHYSRFKKLCFTAFTILRKNANLILNLIALMVDASIPDIKLEPDKAVMKVCDRCSGNKLLLTRWVLLLGPREVQAGPDRRRRNQILGRRTERNEFVVGRFGPAAQRCSSFSGVTDASYLLRDSMH